MSETKALLLAAGSGTRLRPLTDVMPKCLVPVAGRPILEYWVDLLEEVGVSRALINTHALAHLVRRYIEQVNDRRGMQLVESYEASLLGSAGTLAANATFADGADEVILIYADNLSDVDLGAMLNFHRGHGDPVTMLLFRASDPGACGIAELDGDARVVSFVEKPKEPKGDLANAGVYVVDAAAYREMAAAEAFDLGFEVLPKFVGRMRGWTTSGCHLDIGTSQTYQQAQLEARRLLDGRFNSGVPKRAAVFLDRDGTLIEPVHYLSDPTDVKLVCGGAQAIRDLRRAGFACVVVTNQSAVGRGMINDEDLQAIHVEMNRQLAKAGVELDGVYASPSVPTVNDRVTIDHLDRKPGPGMLWRAAYDLGLDVGRSWMVGDMVSDVLAGHYAGCAGMVFLQPHGQRTDDGFDASVRYCTALNLPGAAKRILGRCGLDRLPPDAILADGEDLGLTRGRIQ